MSEGVNCAQSKSFSLRNKPVRSRPELFSLWAWKMKRKIRHYCSEKQTGVDEGQHEKTANVDSNYELLFNTLLLQKISKAPEG